MPKHNTVFGWQARQIIYNVWKFMEKEKNEGVQYHVTQVQQRTAAATGTSPRSVYKIRSEARKSGTSVFRTPGKKRSKPKPITGLDDFDKGVIKRIIHNFHVTENETLTIPKLMTKLQTVMNFKGRRTSLSTIIKELGFKWYKTNKKGKKILMEKHDIRLKRIQFLQQMKKYREEGRPIVYTGESYIHSNHIKSMTWSDKSSIPVGQRIIIIHAGSENGFVPNALWMFKSGTQSDKNMNLANYETWLKTKLIPNLTPDSVVVIDNAPFHNELRNPIPTANSQRDEMELWLTEKGVPFSKEMLMPELNELICQHKSAHKHFLVDDIFAEHNHTVLRLPPYLPDINPIGMAWTAVKNYVAERNVNFDVNQIMQHVEEKVNQIGQDWMALCKQVKHIEDEYRISDYNIDQMMNNFVIKAGDSSESESDRDKESSESDSD